MIKLLNKVVVRRNLGKGKSRGIVSLNIYAESRYRKQEIDRYTPISDYRYIS
jgi:hypothetical protein